jgi:hypothetical protein
MAPKQEVRSGKPLLRFFNLAYFTGHPMRLLVRTISYFALCLTLFGAEARSKEHTIELQVGESGALFQKRYSNLARIDRQPTGLNFYEFSFRGANVGRAIVKVGDREIPIEHVLSITGIEDLDFKEEGISEIHINSTITKSDLISHDEARLKFFSMLQNIVQAGWKTIIPRSMARLKGKEMTKYLLASDGNATLDPSYVPTLDEWMQMEDLTSWKGYANHVYLIVSFTREHTLTDPKKLGAYLLSFEFISDAEQFRRHVESLVRKRWKEVVPVKLRELAAERAKLESELRSKGFVVDEGYIDPPVPDLTNQ